MTWGKMRNNLPSSGTDSASSTVLCQKSLTNSSLKYKSMHAYIPIHKFTTHFTDIEES